MLTKEMKKKQVAGVSENFSKSKGSFLVNCIGLKVEEATQLRKSLNLKQAELTVIRNTLAQLALKEHAQVQKAYESYLKGTNAFVFFFGDDASGVAKILDETNKSINPVFKVKCGFVNGELLEEKDVKILAQLPSKEVLQAQFLSVLQAPLSQFLRILQGVPEGFVRVLSSQKDKQEN